MQIDSLIKGDLNSFKANNFEIPIRNLIKDYEAKGVSDLKKGRIATPGSIEHAHYWVIEYSTDEIVEGICKICFQTREFLNRIEDNSPWMTREEKEEGLWKNT